MKHKEYSDYKRKLEKMLIKVRWQKGSGSKGPDIYFEHLVP